MSKKNREKRKARKGYAYRKNPFFTPRLNAGLELIMRDQSRDGVTLVWAWTARQSWGNWSAYAIEDRPCLPAPEDFDPAAELRHFRLCPDLSRIGALDQGPCPLCGEMRPSGEVPAHDWPWHLSCMAAAYAVDAMECGAYRSELDWAHSVVLHGMPPAGGVQ